MDAIIGRKQTQTQKFLIDGTRVPVTLIEVKANPVVMIKTALKDGYISVQLGYGMRKHANKPELGHAKKGANLDYAPSFLSEIRLPKDVDIESLPKQGDKVSAPAIFEPGDIVDVMGTSKGKGFAGGVKRHHFKGGPRTHGQSDRERAPGSIGQTTTPGRVYKGKRMAGKMGFEQVTIRNLTVVDVTPDGLLIKGLVPGIPGSYIVIKKVGKNKKFSPLLKKEIIHETNVVDKTSEVVVPDVTTEKKVV